VTVGRHVAFTVGPDEDRTRLDVAVVQHVEGMSRSAAQELVRGGRVRVNGKTARPSYRVTEGESVEVEVVPRPGLTAAPEDIPLSIVYQDSDVAVLDKPAGLVVHPAAGHVGGTLANALTALFPEVSGIGAPQRPGIVHRLDRDTSGLMVVALTPEAHASLQAQIAARTARRNYLTLVGGAVRPEEGVIDAPIGRDPRQRKRMGVHGVAARGARTAYRVLEQLSRFTYVEARLETGRTHQIRVHFAAIGHPVAGDRVYGGAALPGLTRQFLHAWKLAFQSPSAGQTLQFESPLPRDLQEVLEGVRRAG
jgi:23S rRNA pseudouridine1911/1915/1917 synthase